MMLLAFRFLRSLLSEFSPLQKTYHSLFYFEIQSMAKLFKLALVSKLLFARAPMDVIGKFFFFFMSLRLKWNSQVSLLDNRHIIIKLEMQEDYSRIWSWQTQYVNSRGMRIFKWTIDFGCSEESSIVPIRVSFRTHLPIHFTNFK